MKVNAPDHPKLVEFQCYLGISKALAIGYLELFWLFTAKNAPQGDVGKWSNASIATLCSFEPTGEQTSDTFMHALIHARLVDECPQHRLLVHDWHDHMPAWVKTQMKKKNLPLLTGPEAPQPQAESTTEGVEAARETRTTDAHPVARRSRTGTSRVGKGSLGKGSEQRSIGPPPNAEAPAPESCAPTPLGENGFGDQRRPARRMLSMNQRIRVDQFMLAKAKRNDLSEEEINNAWDRFVSHHVSRGIALANLNVAWQQWIQDTRATVVSIPKQAPRQGSMAEQTAHMPRELYGGQL